MNCTTCDAPLTPGTLFCANCGTRVTTTSSAGAPTTASPAAYDEQAGGAAPQPYTPQPYSPPQPYSATPSYVQTSQPTSSAAIVSLIFGIIAWVILPVIGAIVAVIAGHMARNEIRASNGQLGGNGLATAGLVLGYVQIGLTVLACIGFVILVAIGAASSR